MNINKCRICNNIDANESFECFEKMFGSNERFDYFICSECNCLQINKVPQNIAEYYPSNYYSFNSQSKSLRKKIKERFKRTFHGMIPKRKIEINSLGLENLSLNNSSSILDVGCGKGNFLVYLKNQGMLNVLGIDPYIDEDVFLDGKVLVRKITLNQLEGSFDLIMMHHSFEHMFEQHDVLSEINRLLKPDGKVLIRIPLKNYAFEKYGNNWVSLDAPRHFYLHTEKSLRILVEECGFKITEVIYDSDEFQFWGSEQYLKGIELFSKESYAVDKSKIEKSKIEEYRAQARKLNLEGKGDQACFYLKKVAQ